MFTITVVFGNASASLMYRDRDKAAAIWAVLSKKTVDTYPMMTSGEMVIADEFGREIYLPPNMLYGAIFEDMNSSTEATIEVSMHNARTQVKAQKRASSDPELRAAQMGHGPSVLTPMGGMNGRFS